MQNNILQIFFGKQVDSSISLSNSEVSKIFVSNRIIWKHEDKKFIHFGTNIKLNFGIIPIRFVV